MVIRRHPVEADIVRLFAIRHTPIEVVIAARNGLSLSGARERSE
jgi:hypothetical protein